MISYTPIIQNLSIAEPYTLDLLRLDLLDKEISGNKWFKLKYNLEQAIASGLRTVITCGGAFSNHIAASAAACMQYNLRCIGIIRGDETDDLNVTLKQAKQNGMELHFVNRELYSRKQSEEFTSYLQDTFGAHYFIPEGGNNREGVLGCVDIIQPQWDYDYIVCACGTATTFAGLVAARQASKVVGISVLKGENTLPRHVEKLLETVLDANEIRIQGNEALNGQELSDHCILNAYAFKGYAKPDPALSAFKTEFENTYHIPLDHIYTVKLMYGVVDLIKRSKFRPWSKILAVHSGGLQGNAGFEQRYHLTPSR